MATETVRGKEEFRCPQHGPLVLRPKEHQTPEQLWCGTWYDCVQRDYTVLVHGDELDRQLDEQYQSLRREYERLSTKKARTKYLAGCAPWIVQWLTTGVEHPYLKNEGSGES
jgi:hypothetical protein